MRDRHEKILKLICLVFAAVLAFQLTGFVLHGSSTRRLVVPALPSLPPEPGSENARGTNSASGKPSTNATSAAKPGTNAASTNLSSKPGSTNLLASKSSPVTTTSSVPTTLSETNSTLSAEAGPSATNAAFAHAGDKQSTNDGSTELSGKTTTNFLAQAKTGKDGTNSTTSKAPNKKGPSPGGRPGIGNKTPELPPQIKERVDRITQSEMLGQVMHPLPMALLGIGGQSAFLRSPEGQTGLIKEGDQLGTIKLLRIGTNRVIIEQDGEKKELVIFAGLGSETLLPKTEKTTNEPTRKIPK